jgi:hypothetical protein
MFFFDDEHYVDDYFKIISECLVPGLRRLHIRNSYDGRPLESWKIKCLQSHCASTLEYLLIGLHIAYNKELDELHHVLQHTTYRRHLQSVDITFVSVVPLWAMQMAVLLRQGPSIDNRGMLSQSKQGMLLYPRL